MLLRNQERAHASPCLTSTFIPAFIPRDRYSAVMGDRRLIVTD